ncbi:MAG: hypothetical protein U9P12_07750 [Verrucomicrobiota bacterium]|nr:hypothetical protein [Verrucomicrobiota bacterium]
MVRKIFEDVVLRIDAMLAGHNECRGMFKVLDGEGAPLGDVDVQYRVGDSEWMPCGKSSCSSDGVNFSQLSTVFYPIGEPVVWHFSKPGYEYATVTRYMAGKEFEEDLGSVVMEPKEGIAR